MLTGLPPYFSKDTNDMYKKILQSELTFPDYLLENVRLVDLLKKLLAKDPAKRFKSVPEIKNHSWFKHVNWEKIHNKEVPPPFVPSKRETNFDPEFNELPVDFDDLEIKLRLSTERRYSYYYESTLQSKTCTESSFYFH